VLLVAEDERNAAALVHQPPRGYGLDGAWADDRHHHLRVALAGDRERYFADFDGTTAAIAATIRAGCSIRARRRLAPVSHAAAIQPVSIRRDSGCACRTTIRLATARLPIDSTMHRSCRLPRGLHAAVVRPQTPLLFMGQEWAASTPFLYSTDHAADLGRLVTEGAGRVCGVFGFCGSGHP
jgi:maltooligosyltrehalose trehalohydrolase